MYGESQYSSQPGVYYVTNRSGSWVSLRLSSVGTFGVAIAVDPYGEAHVVAGSSGSIDYYTNRKGYFKEHRLVNGGAWYPDIALDGDRRIHVVHEVQEGTTGIHSVTNASGNWSSTQSSTGARDADTKPSVALGAAGAIHVAYARSGDDAGINHVTNASGTWVTTQVSALAASEPKIALLGDAPSIVYLAARVHFAALSGASWTSVRLNEDGQSPNLALAPGGVQRIVYGNGHDILLVSSTSIPWSLTPLSSGDDRQPSEVTGPDGSLHAVWARTGTEPGIYYGTDQGGSWVETRLTTAADSEPSLGLDGDSHLYVAFRRNAATWQNSGVFLLTNASGVWETTRIREGADPEDYGDTDDHCPSIAVDAAGHVQVVMYDTITPYGIRMTAAHFSNATGAWVRTEITSENPALHETAPCCMSLATDEAFHVQLAWRNNDFGGDQIRYTTNASGSWVTTTVASGAVLEPSIALDADGSVFIAFGRGDEYGSIGVDYVTNGSGSWVRQSIPAPGISVGVGGASAARPALAVGSGALDLAFAGSGTYYATNRGGAWTTVRLTSNAGDHEVGSGLSQPGLVVDAGGHVRIIFPREAVGLQILSQ